MDQDTIFHWASVTKCLTAVAVMQLRDDGKLSLDDPAVSHLPELGRVHSTFGPISQVQGALTHLGVGAQGVSCQRGCGDCNLPKQ